MTKEELDRIKKAYSSGLKVQIWFDGHWENFDAREYSMCPEPFSENRQYRIVGSDYADIAEKQIVDLEAENAELKEDLRNKKLAIQNRNGRIKELEEKISVLLSCKNCPENKGGFICEKEYENKCLAQKIQFIKELQEEIAELEEKYVKNICDCDICDTYCNSQLTKAKEIMRELIHEISVFYIATDRTIISPTVKEAEQFLKNSEVKKL